MRVPGAFSLSLISSLIYHPKKRTEQKGKGVVNGSSPGKRSRSSRFQVGIVARRRENTVSSKARGRFFLCLNLKSIDKRIMLP